MKRVNSPSFFTDLLLCDLGQVTSHLSAPNLLFVKLGIKTQSILSLSLTQGRSAPKGPRKLGLGHGLPPEQDLAGPALATTSRLLLFSPPALCSGHTTCLSFPGLTNFIPTLGFLHQHFLLPGKVFPKMAI